MFIFLDIEPDGNEDSKMFEIAYMTQNRMTASRLFKRFKPYRKNRDNDLKNSDFAIEYPKPRFNTVFFDIAKSGVLEKAVIQKMVDVSKGNLIITPNLLWKTAEDGH